MKLWVLLPAFNEEASLPVLLPKIDEIFKKHLLDYKIVIVDDGSSDRTNDLLKSYSQTMPVEIITHEINRGLGETERDGFEYIAANSADEDMIIRIDCDDTHEPMYFINMIDKIKEGYDVVVASRFQKGGGQKGVNAYRALISFSASLFMKIMFNIKGVRDYSCGYRIYRASIIKNAIGIFGNQFIQLKGIGFTSTLETIVKLKLMGCRFGEVPFMLRYDQKVSSSKMVSSITTFGYFAMAVLYHWPFGGWRSAFKRLAADLKENPEKAVTKYSKYRREQRNVVGRIGGG